MTIEGVDYSFGRPTSPQALYDAGKRFACRYLATLPNSKAITRDEADGLAAAGIWIVANWEDSGKGNTSPENAGARALSQAHALGIPRGRPIYASVDFDVQSGDYDRVRDWISRFHAALKGEYDGRALYGSYYVIKAGLDEGWLKWGWQTYAWSYGHRDPRAQLYQHKNGVVVAGAEVDLDTAYHDDYGQWMPGKLPDGTDPADPEEEEEDEMKPTVHARETGGKQDEWMLGHPQFGEDLPTFDGTATDKNSRLLPDKSVKIFRGFMVTVDHDIFTAWARTYAKGTGEITSSTDRDGYIAIQKQLSQVAAEMARGTDDEQ